MELLNERAKTHGAFGTNAYYSQTMKELFRESSWKSIPQVQRESLDAIALKLSRILSGSADFKDHWDDIAGYATLAANSCKNQSSS